MGYITLDSMRDDVEETLGNRGLTDAKLTRYINSGYLDVAGSLNFQVLNSESTLVTVSGQDYVTAPTNLYAIKFVQDTSRKTPLSWSPLAEILRQASSPTGRSTKWNHFGSKVYLRPVPNGIFNLTAFVRRSITKLSADGDVSVLPDEFDEAIFFLAASHGFLIQNEEQRAAYYLSLAINNLQAKVVEQDVDNHLIADGTSGLAALQERLRLMQQGS